CLLTGEFSAPADFRAHSKDTEGDLPSGPALALGDNGKFHINWTKLKSNLLIFTSGGPSDDLRPQFPDDLVKWQCVFCHLNLLCSSAMPALQSAWSYVFRVKDRLLVK